MVYLERKGSDVIVFLYEIKKKKRIYYFLQAEIARVENIFKLFDMFCIQLIDSCLEKWVPFWECELDLRMQITCW